MSGEGFDPCECLWSQNIAVQRLLSILRQTQAYCTDSECFNISSLPGPRESGRESDFLTLCLVFGVVALMYVLRPNSLRRPHAIGAPDKRSDSNDDPPAPPPAIN